MILHMGTTELDHRTEMHEKLSSNMVYNASIPLAELSE